MTKTKKPKKQYAISKIVCPVDCKFGAPMGRGSNKPSEKPANKKIFDRAVPLSSDGAYDKGGAYWGIATNGRQLRVEYTKDLSYVRFYRLGEK